MKTKFITVIYFFRIEFNRLEAKSATLQEQGKAIY